MESTSWNSMVRFGGGEMGVGAHAFEVTACACENPDCPCEELTLCFREQSPKARRPALAFDVHVDLAGDAPASAKGLGAAADRLAAKVALEVGGTARPALRGALREKRERLRTIDQTVMEYSREGEIVPWSHVLAGGRPDDEESFAFLDQHDDGVREWDVMDFVCANPRCACEEVILSFTVVGEESDDDARFGVRVPLGQGDATFEEPDGVTLAEARVVFAGWEATTRFDRGALRARYDRVKAIVTQGTAAPVPAPRPLGRRDPCPCGSGKRYKNCCGRDAG